MNITKERVLELKQEVWRCLCIDPPERDDLLAILDDYDERLEAPGPTDADERALGRIRMCLDDLHRLEEGGEKDMSQDLAALAHLRSRLAEVEERKKELAESRAETMAHFETSEKFAVTIEGLRAEVERLRSEVTKTAKSGDRESQSADEWATKFMKAEAEVVEHRARSESFRHQMNEFHAMYDDARDDLEAARPLLEVADGADPEWVRIELDELSRVRTEDAPTMRLLRAALDYRQAKEKK